MEYASNGKGNLGVTLGAIGTGLGVLSGTGLLSGFNGMGMYGCPHNGYVTKNELDYVQQLASKDSAIALLEAEKVSEQKMIEVYRQAHDEIVTLRNTVEANRREQDAWNASQSVANAQMSAAIATNTNSIAAINNIIGQITQVRVPNSAVCPGWGAVEVTPA